MIKRPFWLSCVLMFGTVAAGLAVRFAHLRQPPAVAKYGGSALWALMIYWVVSTLAPRMRPPRAAIAAISLATAVEFFKLVNTPGLQAFRSTIAGILLLGRIFSVRDIAAYCVAIACGACADAALRRWLARRRPPAQ